MSAQGAGLGPLSGGVGAMQTYVMFPGLQLLPAEPDVAGKGPWAKPNLRKGDKHQYKHIPSQGALCPQSPLRTREANSIHSQAKLLYLRNGRSPVDLFTGKKMGGAGQKQKRPWGAGTQGSSFVWVNTSQ